MKKSKFEAIPEDFIFSEKRDKKIEIDREKIPVKSDAIIAH